MDAYTTSRSSSTGGLGDETTLWEGSVNTTGVTMTLSDSIENYKYIMIKRQWYSTSTKLEMLAVKDILKYGYGVEHILIAPYSTYYLSVSFTSNSSAAIIGKTGDMIYISGIYGIK